MGKGDIIPYDKIESLVVLSCSIYMHDIVNNLLHTTDQAMHIVYITLRCFQDILWCWYRTSMRTCSRKGIIIYTKYVNANVFQERDYYLYKVCDVY